MARFVGDLANRDCDIYVSTDAAADFDEEMYKMSLKRMENIYSANII